MARPQRAFIKAGKLIKGLYCAGVGRDEPTRNLPTDPNHDPDRPKNDFSLEKCSNPKTPYRHRETTVWTYGRDACKALQERERKQHSGREASPSTSGNDMQPKFDLSTIFENDEPQSPHVTFALPSESHFSREHQPANAKDSWDTLSDSSTLVDDESVGDRVAREYGPNPFSYEYPFAEEVGEPCQSISLRVPDDVDVGLQLCLTIASERPGGKRSYIPLLRIE